MTAHTHTDSTAPSPPLRAVMSQFATGVVVLGVGGDNIHGMTANALTSVSLSPPLVLCCVAHSAVMHDAITNEEHFAASVLGADQRHLARHFADKARPLGAAQFESVSWVPGPNTGAPLIDGASAWLECVVVDAHNAGDHTIFVGSVRSASSTEVNTSLVYYDGGYQTLFPSDFA